MTAAARFSSPSGEVASPSSPLWRTRRPSMTRSRARRPVSRVAWFASARRTRTTLAASGRTPKRTTSATSRARNVPKKRGPGARRPRGAGRYAKRTGTRKTSAASPAATAAPADVSGGSTGAANPTKPSGTDRTWTRRGPSAVPATPTAFPLRRAAARRDGGSSTLSPRGPERPAGRVPLQPLGRDPIRHLAGRDPRQKRVPIRLARPRDVQEGRRERGRDPDGLHGVRRAAAGTHDAERRRRRLERAADREHVAELGEILVGARAPRGRARGRRCGSGRPPAATARDRGRRRAPPSARSTRGAIRRASPGPRARPSREPGRRSACLRPRVRRRRAASRPRGRRRPSRRGRGGRRARTGRRGARAHAAARIAAARPSGAARRPPEAA